MKRFIYSIIILLCFTGFSFAQQMTEQEGEQQKKMMEKMDMGKMMEMKKGMKDHMQSGMHSMKYSMIVHHILMKANAIDLTDVQKKELADIKIEYLYPMVQKESDFKISHMKIMDMFHNPEFNTAKLKSEIKTSNQLNLELANMMVDALTATRKSIGLDNFKKIMKMMPMMSDGRMESGDMTEKKGDSSSEHEGHH